jgi:hypothetical protein
VGLEKVLLCVVVLLSAELYGSPLLDRGDGAFRDRRNPKRAREALEIYREARQKDPKNAQVLWRLAMATQFVGHRLAKADDEKLELFGEGRDAATEAAKLDPDCGPCHFWAGINRAQYGSTSGIFRTIATLGIVRQNLERAAEIDPSYAFGGPNRVLGLIDQKVPGILGGSNSRAVEHFEKAIQAAPDSPLNYLFLAQHHRLEREDDAAFRETLKRAKQKVKVPPPAEVESYEAWRELTKITKESELVPEPAKKVDGHVGHVGRAVHDG